MVKQKTFLIQWPKAHLIDRVFIQKLLEQRVVEYIGTKPFYHTASYGSMADSSYNDEVETRLAFGSFGDKHGADYVVKRYPQRGGSGLVTTVVDCDVDLYRTVRN